jgi:signal transduction histidine kinase
MTLATLRSRLLLGTGLATAAILLAAGAAVYVFVRISLVGEFDRGLASSARALAALVEEDEKGVIQMEPQAQVLTEYTRKESPDYYAVWLDDGRQIARSPAPGELPRPRTPSTTGAVLVESFILPDGQPGRLVTLTFAPPVEDAKGNLTAGRRQLTLAVARHTTDVDRKLARLAALLGGTGALATLASAGVMFLAIRRGLRPLDTLAARIAAAGRRDLAERVELADAPAELVPVVARLNELLDRIEETIVRERRFTADVAHELRTPLAGLQAILDVCATRRRPAEEYERTLARCARIARAMHAMVENLMTLARADARQLTVARAPVNLATLVEDAWSLFAPAADQKSIAAVFQFDALPEISSDAGKLRIVVNNLLDNAVSHGEAGGWLRVQGREHGDDGADTLELIFSNGGSRLTADQARRVFDRFWRGDEARGDTGLHCGLGLSLCREVVTLLGGTIDATSGADGVFTVRLTLPRGPSGARPAREPAADALVAASPGGDEAR